MQEALPFYEAFLPALGLTQRCDGGAWRLFATTVSSRRRRTSGLPESAELVANENRSAFRVESREEVDGSPRWCPVRARGA